MAGPRSADRNLTKQLDVMLQAVVSNHGLARALTKQKDNWGTVREEHAMANTLPVRYNPPATDELHPWVYRAIIGLTIWLVLSVWVLFSRGAYESLTLSVITLFFLILVGIPVLLWLTWRRNTDPKEQHGFVAPFGLLCIRICAVRAIRRQFSQHRHVFSPVSAPPCSRFYLRLSLSSFLAPPRPVNLTGREWSLCSTFLSPLRILTLYSAGL